jgi:hypothetical protein
MSFILGQSVIFGRPNGEQTLGVIVKINAKSIKVAQTENRGNHPAGTVWTVAPALVRTANGTASATPEVTKPTAKPASVLEDASSFARKATLLGLPTDCLGKWITLGYGKQVQIIGLEPRRPAYPVSVLGTQGGRYKLPVANVLRVLNAAAKPVVPVARRTPDQIMSDILDCYCGLSPENLSCDGEASLSHMRAERARINRRLSELFRETGRTVSEDEAYRWHMSQERVAR